MQLAGVGLYDLTSGLSFNDPRRFNSGSPKEMKYAMARAWPSYIPTSLRMIEDIQALSRVLDVIIKAKGCMVKD